MSNRAVVVYTGPADSAEAARDVLGSRFDVVAVEPSEESVYGALHDAVALLDASMRVPVTAEVIERCPNLRLISTATTGASHIATDALEARGITLLTLKGQTDVLRDLTPAAEQSWLLLMACARMLRPAIRHVEAGGWDRTLFPGKMLKGSAIGIIGLGRIGGWMARYAGAFDMRVLAYDPLLTEAPEGVEMVSMERLLGESDFVTLHVNLTTETTGLLDDSRIRLMKRGAVFINTSRGELTDEEALVSALDEGRLSAVGVDVLVGEPNPGDSPLWRYSQTHDNVIISPHVGGFSPQAVDIVVRFAAQRIRDHLAE